MKKINKKFEIFTAPSYQIQKKISSHKKKHLLVLSRGRGKEYTMENKDANTNYQKVDGVGDRRWKIVEITTGIIFICLRFVSFFYTGSF